MKIEEIKCPGCGAPITPTEGQKVYRCEYCNTVYMPEDNSFDEEKEQIQLQMERDKAKAYKERLEWDNKEYKRKKRKEEREQKRKQKRQVRDARAPSCGGCFAVFLFFAFLAGMYVFSYYNAHPENLKKILNSQYEESSAPAQKIIKNLDEVPKVTLDRINNDSLKKKNGMYEALYGSWKNEGSEVVGNYLVSYDNEDGNLIFSVVKTTYSCDDPSKTQTLYTAFVTTHLCLKSNGTTVQSHPEKVPAYVNDSYNGTTYLDPNAGIPSMVHGWRYMKDLYKECISYIEIPYHVSYTKDMYVPQNADETVSQSSYKPSTGDPDAEEEEKTEEEETALEE